jgi:hypothetical protein
MKCRIHLTTQGWLPQDPYIPSRLKIVSNRHNRTSKAKIVAGSTLLLISLIAISMALMSMQQTNEIFDKNLVINANERNSPMFVCGTYRTHSPCAKPPTHEGTFVVNHGTVEFTVISTAQITKTYYHNGKNVTYTVGSNDPNDTHQVINATIKDTYNFSVPANGDYEFIIQNSGDQPVTVNFKLKTTCIYLMAPIVVLGILLGSALPGAVLITSGCKVKKQLSQ